MTMRFTFRQQQRGAFVFPSGRTIGTLPEEVLNFAAAAFVVPFRAFSDVAKPLKVSKKGKLESRGQQHLRCKNLARELIKKKEAWKLKDFDDAKAILGLFRQKKLIGSETVNLSFGLLERYIKDLEVASQHNDDFETEIIERRWLTQSKFFTPFFHKWRCVALKKYKRHMVYSPKKLLGKLITMHKRFRQFRINTTATGIMMEVIIQQQSNRNDAPYAAQDFLNFLLRASRSNPELDPDEYTYSQVLQAWMNATESKDPRVRAEINHRMDAILDHMKDKQVQLSVVTLDLLLRFWDLHGHPVRAGKVLSEMTQRTPTTPALTPDIVRYNRMLSACSRASSADEKNQAAELAWNTYQQMIHNNVELDVEGFNALIPALARGNERQFIQRADDLLRLMETNDRPDLNQPDYRHFVPVTMGWLSVGDVRKAQDVLMRSIRAYTESNIRNAAPTSILIDMVIERGWMQHFDTNDDEQTKWNNAVVLLDDLQHMKDDKTIPEGPSLKAYKAVLSSLETATMPNEQAQLLKLRLTNQIRVLTGERDTNI